MRICIAPKLRPQERAAKNLRCVDTHYVIIMYSLGDVNLQ